MRVSQKWCIGGLALSFFLSIGCRSGPNIRGVVTDKNGKPVAEALVYILAVHGNDLSKSAVRLTDSSGTYSAMPETENTHIYRILANQEAFEPASRVVDTDTIKSVDFRLEPRIIYEGTYKVGDEVQARDAEWCPARIISIGTGAYQGRYEIDFPNSGGVPLMLRSQDIRPKNAGPMETHFACPFQVKVEPATHTHH